MFVKKQISSAGIDYLLELSRCISSEGIKEYVVNRLNEEDNDWYGMKEETTGDFILNIGEAVFHLPRHFVINAKVNKKLREKYVDKVLDL
jgi:hypothetical protein